MSKGSVFLRMIRIGRVRAIWDKVLFKLIVSFNGMVSRKVFLESSHRIETHIDVVIEVLEFHISVAFEFLLD